LRHLVPPLDVFLPQPCSAGPKVSTKSYTSNAFGSVGPAPRRDGKNSVIVCDYCALPAACRRKRNGHPCEVSNFFDIASAMKECDCTNKETTFDRSGGHAPSRRGRS
jgi:hypothetical protein